MKLIIIALFSTLCGITYCKPKEISGKMEKAECSEVDPADRAFSSVVSFKKDEEHVVNGALLTVIHAMTLYTLIKESKKWPNKLQVGSCLPEPVEYPIRKFNYDSRQPITIATLNEIVDLQNGHISEIVLRPDAYFQHPDQYGERMTLYRIGRNKNGNCDKKIPITKYHIDGTSISKKFRDTDIELIPGALLIDTEGQLIGMAIDGMQDARGTFMNYEEFVMLKKCIEFWLHKHTQHLLENRFMLDTDIGCENSEGPIYDRIDLLWQGNEETKYIVQN